MKFTWILFFCLLVILFMNGITVASDKNISSSLSHYIMAVIHEDLGDIDRAIDEYKKALKADDKSAVIHLNLASDYIKKKDTAKAIEELNIAVMLDPEAVEPHVILAILYSSENKADIATSEYEKALTNASKLEPKNAEIYRSLGLVYLQQKKFKDAEAIYKLIIELFPDDAQAHFYLANVYNELKDFIAAERELKKTLELKPDYHEALNFLGYLYVEENKNFDKAEIMIKKALEIDPDNGAYIDSMGWLYFKKAKFDEALKELQKASSLLEDAVIYDHLGEVYFQKNDKENARLNWEKSLKLDAKQFKVKEKIERLKK